MRPRTVISRARPWPIATPIARADAVWLTVGGFGRSWVVAFAW